MRRGDQPAFQSTQGEHDASADLPLAELATEPREPNSPNTTAQPNLSSAAVTSAAASASSCRAATDTPRLTDTAGTAVAPSTLQSSTMGSAEEQERLDTLLDDDAPSTAEYQARRAAFDTIEAAATAALELVSSDPSGRSVDSNDHTLAVALFGHHLSMDQVVDALIRLPREPVARAATMNQLLGLTAAQATTPAPPFRSSPPIGNPSRIHHPAANSAAARVDSVAPPDISNYTHGGTAREAYAPLEPPPPPLPAVADVPPLVPPSLFDAALDAAAVATAASPPPPSNVAPLPRATPPPPTEPLGVSPSVASHYPVAPPLPAASAASRKRTLPLGSSSPPAVPSRSAHDFAIAVDAVLGPSPGTAAPAPAAPRAPTPHELSARELANQAAPWVQPAALHMISQAPLLGADQREMVRLVTSCATPYIDLASTARHATSLARLERIPLDTAWHRSVSISLQRHIHTNSRPAPTPVGPPAPPPAAPAPPPASSTDPSHLSNDALLQLLQVAASRGLLPSLGMSTPVGAAPAASITSDHSPYPPGSLAAAALAGSRQPPGPRQLPFFPPAAAPSAPSGALAAAVPGASPGGSPPGPPSSSRLDTPESNIRDICLQLQLDPSVLLFVPVWVNAPLATDVSSVGVNGMPTDFHLLLYRYLQRELTLAQRGSRDRTNQCPPPKLVEVLAPSDSITMQGAHRNLAYAESRGIFKERLLLSYFFFLLEHRVVSVAAGSLLGDLITACNQVPVLRQHESSFRSHYVASRGHDGIQDIIDAIDHEYLLVSDAETKAAYNAISWNVGDKPSDVLRTLKRFGTALGKSERDILADWTAVMRQARATASAPRLGDQDQVNRVVDAFAGIGIIHTAITTLDRQLNDHGVAKLPLAATPRPGRALTGGRAPPEASPCKASCR